jgi:hypothetical protein
MRRPSPGASDAGRKSQTVEAPPSDDPAGEPSINDPADDAPLEMIRCAQCGEDFQGVQAATKHYYAVHGNPENEPTA